MYHKPVKKHYGQHFLVDISVLDEIVRSIKLVSQDRVFEIGPGSGQLTCQLLPMCEALTAVEIDRDCFQYLMETVRPKYKHLNLVYEDILQYDFGRLDDGGRPYRIVGNLPYNIATEIMMRMRDYRHLFVDATFMVQKEVALRCQAQPGCSDYSLLSVMLQTYFQVVLLFDVDPKAFDPPPKVVSSMIWLKPLSDDQIGKIPRSFHKIVAMAFNQRRKMIRQSLKSLVKAQEWLMLDLDGSERPETLSVDQFRCLADYIDGQATKL